MILISLYYLLANKMNKLLILISTSLVLTYKIMGLLGLLFLALV